LISPIPEFRNCPLNSRDHRLSGQTAAGSFRCAAGRSVVQNGSVVQSPGHRDWDGTSGLRKISPHPGALPSEWERVRRRDWAGRWDWDGTPRPPLSVQSRHERRTEEPLTNLGLDHPCCAARVIPAVRGASVLHRNGGRQPSGLDVHQCGLRAAPVVEQKLDNGERHHHPV
jgi:hypothetical protein